MTNLERLKVELNNKTYYTDEILTMYLLENELVGSVTYVKESKAKILQTVLDILESLSNDIDMFRSVETEFATTQQAYAQLQKRLNDIRKRISELSKTDEYSSFGYMYYTR